MAKPYSIDFRQRALAAFDNGEKSKILCERFIISEKNLYLWRKQREKRGHIRPIIKYQKDHSHKLIVIS